MREHPDELRADFQEHFGLCLDDMGRGLSIVHAAALIGQLPEGSRVRAAYLPQSAWTTDRLLAAGILNALNFIAWTKTKDGQRNRNRPRPVGPSASARRGSRRPAMAMTVERLNEELAKKRTGVGHGQH